MNITKQHYKVKSVHVRDENGPQYINSIMNTELALNLDIETVSYSP